MLSICIVTWFIIWCVFCLEKKTPKRLQTYQHTYQHRQLMRNLFGALTVCFCMTCLRRIVLKQVIKKSMRHTQHESDPLGLGDDVGWRWIKRADDERKRQCAPPHNNLSEQRRCLFSTTHWQSNQAERQDRRNWVLCNLLWIFPPLKITNEFNFFFLSSKEITHPHFKTPAENKNLDLFLFLKQDWPCVWWMYDFIIFHCGFRWDFSTVIQ